MEPLQVAVVTTKNDTTIRGLLATQQADLLVLRAAAIMGEENGRTVWRNLPGETVIPLANVDYWQQGLPPDLLDQLGVSRG